MAAGIHGGNSRRPPASVIIPVHNAEETIGAQLESLARQEGAPSFEVIAVLNRCTDASAQLIHAFSDRLAIRIVPADEKASAAYARNAGARESTASKILFCDADDRVGPMWVAGILNALDEAELVGGPVLVDRAGLPGWIYERFYAHLDDQPLNLRDGRIRYPISASMGVDRSAFEAVGGFDETFPGAAGEEVDLAIRLLREGCRVGFAPEATLTYRPRTSVRAVANQQRAYARAVIRLAHSEGLPTPSASRAAEAGNIARLLAHHLVRRREINLGRIRIEVATLRSKALAARQLAAAPIETYGNEPGVVDVVVPLEIPGIGGRAFVMRASVASWFSRWIVERLSLDLASRLCRPGDVAIDVGANVGLFSTALGIRLGPLGHVLAFEPNPVVHRLLERNLSRHGMTPPVATHDFAVGCTTGDLSMIVYDNDLLSGFTASALDPAAAGSSSSIKVRVCRLDDEVPGSVDFIKIDVEGHELDVLDGATSLLERSPGAILLVEINPDAQRLGGRDPELLLQRVSQDDRAVWLVEDPLPNRQGSIRVLDDAVRAFVLTSTPGWYGNLLSVPPSRRADAMKAIRDVQAGGLSC